MRLAIILGNRPQFIKFAPLCQQLQQDNVEFCTIHTLQHHNYELNQAIFHDLQLPNPDYEMPFPIPSGNAFIDKATRFIGQCLKKEKPSHVIVFGDTNTTFAGALAASKEHIPLVHIEAGLRSNNYAMPEEFNRSMTDYLSDWLFAPTQKAFDNLREERVSGKACISGDIMLDAFLLYKDKAKPPQVQLPPTFCLATLHRNFNTDDTDRLSTLVEQLNAIHDKCCPVVLPAHPRLSKALKKVPALKNDIIRLAPVSYLKMLWLLQHCQFVITDSGGLQKEAFFAGKPSLLPRAETEWTELLDIGSSRLVRAEQLYEASLMVRNATPPPFSKVFGDGRASRLIVDKLKEV